jgi:hypothetical protein
VLRFLLAMARLSGPSERCSIVRSTNSRALATTESAYDET